MYTQIVPELWIPDRKVSRIEALMKAYQPSRTMSQSRPGDAKEVKMSQISFEEDRHEREMLNIRNFGYHWLKPIGISKTMGQLYDEAREIQESFEEYEDEDNQFNQNNPEIMAGMEGQDIMSEEGADRDLNNGQEQDGEGQDLDEEIEEGASFDAGDTSHFSSPEAASPPMQGGLRDVHNGIFVQLMEDHGSSSTDEEVDGEVEQGEEEIDGGMSSAEEGSIGGYSTDDHDATE